MISDRLGNDISDSVRRGFAGANRDIDNQGRDAGRRAGRAAAGGVDDVGPEMDRAGRRAGERIGTGMRNEVNRRQRPRMRALFKGFGSDLGKEFNLGIGAARMGEAAISGLVLIAPSLLSGFGAVLTALAGEIVNFAAAIGPGVAASLGVAAVGVSTLALNIGLLKLAFSGTGPQAKAFKAQFADFKTVLTESFAPGVLSGFSDMIKTLRDALLPAVNGLLKDTGTAMGDIARHLGDVVTSGDNLRRLQSILATNVTFLGNFKTAAGGLVSAFLTLFSAAKPVVDMIGTGLANFGTWAANTLLAKEASGELAAFMDRLVQNFRDFWSFLKDIGTGIVNVFQAASGPGKSLFDSMSGIAERFAAWTSNPDNQARMTKFFETARVISQQIFDLLGAIFTAGGKAFTNVDTSKLQHFFDTLRSVGGSIASIFDQIKAGAGGNLSKIFDDIGVILDRAAASGAVTNFANAISSLALALADLVVTLTANPIGAQVAGLGLAFLLFGGIIKTVLGPLLALGEALATLAKGPLLAGLSGLATALGAPLVVVAGAIAALVGILVLAYTQSESFRTAIGDLVSAVGGAFAQVWDTIGPKITEVWGKILLLAQAIGDRLAPVIEFLAPIIAEAIRFIGEIFANILDFLGGFIDVVTGILTGDWGRIWQGVVEMLGAAWDMIKTLFAAGLAFISAIWDSITAVVYAVGQILYGIVTSVWTGIWSLITTIASAIWDFLQAGWVFVVTLIGTLLQGFVIVVVAIFQGLYDGVSQLVTLLWTALVSIWNFIYEQVIQRVIDLYNALVQWFTDADAQIQAIWAGIPAWAAGLWNSFFASVIQPVIDLYNNLVQWFTNADAEVQRIWDGIPAWAGGIWDRVYDAVIQPVIDIYNDMVKWFTDADAEVGRVWASVTDALAQPIKDAWSIIKPIIDTITGAIQGAIDFVGRLTSAITSTPDVPNPVGSGVAGGSAFGGPTKLFTQHFHAMLMPPVALATGGLVRATPGGVHALLGEGGRNERVEPLDSNGMSRRDISMIESIVAALTGNGGTNVTIRIGERELTDVITTVVTEHDRNLARRARTARRPA